jgi:hypothetical protein
MVKKFLNRHDRKSSNEIEKLENGGNALNWLSYTHVRTEEVKKVTAFEKNVFVLPSFKLCKVQRSAGCLVLRHQLGVDVA